MGPENGVQNLDRVLGSVIFFGFRGPQNEVQISDPM